MSKRYEQELQRYYANLSPNEFAGTTPSSDLERTFYQAEVERRNTPEFAPVLEAFYAQMPPSEFSNAKPTTQLEQACYTAEAERRSRSDYEREAGRRGVPAKSDPIFSSASPPQTPRARKVLMIAGIIVGVSLVGGYLAVSASESLAASSYLDKRQADLKRLEHSENLMARLSTTVLNSLKTGPWGACKVTASQIAVFTQTVDQEEELVAAAQPLLDFERGHPDTWPSAVQSVASNRERLAQLEDGIAEKLRQLRQENALARRALAACVPAE